MTEGCTLEAAVHAVLRNRALIRTHASIGAGGAPNAAMTFVGIPSDARSTLTNEEWRINAQLRLSLPLASYYNQPHAVCPHGCRHPLTKEPVNAQFGWHLVTNCPKANQGKKSHNDVEAVLMNHINNHTHMTATKAKFFPGDKLQADIFITGVTTIDNPAARNWHLDVTSTNPMGVTNQELINGLPLATSRAQRSTILATTSSPAQSARRSASTPSTTPSARQQGRSCHLSSSKRRAGTVPPPPGEPCVGVPATCS